MGKRLGTTGSVWVALIGLLLMGCGGDAGTSIQNEVTDHEGIAAPEPLIRFGLNWDEYSADSGTVASGQSLSHLLGGAGVSSNTLFELVAAAEPVYDVRRIRADRPYWILSTEADSIQQPEWFIYQSSGREYIRFHLMDSLFAEADRFPVDTVTHRLTGTITQSLSADLERLGAPFTLALSLANVYAWTVDFSRLQEGDTFDVLYERELVNGDPVGMPRVIACHFTHNGRVIPAYRYDQGNGHDYFDDTGASLRKAFLKAPVEFSRISSRYNLKRFHPVLNRVKAHLGTDYAAPHGTPILAVGDGVVTKSGYTSGNGNYVKLRHNSTYETQYLHMSKRAVRVGESVRQGQVIGYVGATGLATGPHVCFRFWKNGKQVDHLREEFPPSEPIEAAHAADFEATVKTLKAELEGS